MKHRDILLTTYKNTVFTSNFPTEKCIRYCILCSIDLMHVKMEFSKTTLKLLYMIDYLLFNNTK